MRFTCIVMLIDWRITSDLMQIVCLEVTIDQFVKTNGVRLHGSAVRKDKNKVF